MDHFIEIEIEKILSDIFKIIIILFVSARKRSIA